MSAFPNKIKHVPKKSLLRKLWLFFKPSWITLAVFVPSLFLIMFFINAWWTLLSPSHLIITIIQRYSGSLNDFNYSNDFRLHGIPFYYVLGCVANAVWMRRKQGQTKRILETMIVFSVISAIMVFSFFLTTLDILRTVVLEDGASCKQFQANSVWTESNRTCAVQNDVNIGRSEFILIGDGVTLQIQKNVFVEISGTISNTGTLYNLGTIIINSGDNGIVDNKMGVLSNALNSTVINEGIIENHRSLLIFSNSTLINNAQIHNHGEFFSDSGLVKNAGTITNYCDGELRLYFLEINPTLDEC